MDTRIKLTATSHPDEDRMLVEIDIEGHNVAELLETEGDYELLLYPRPGGGPWSFPASLWSEAVGAAHRRLDALLGRNG